MKVHAPTDDASHIGQSDYATDYSTRAVIARMNANANVPVNQRAGKEADRLSVIAILSYLAGGPPFIDQGAAI